MAGLPTEIVVHDFHGATLVIKVRLSRPLRLRIRLGTWLLRLAAFVMGMALEVEEQEP